VITVRTVRRIYTRADRLVSADPKGRGAPLTLVPFGTTLCCLPPTGGVGQKRTGLELRRFTDSASAKLTSLGEGGCTCRLEDGTVVVGELLPQRSVIGE
jgi:hypothetical protein